MDIEDAAAHLRSSSQPLVISVPRPPVDVLNAVFARFEAAGADIEHREGGRVCLSLGPVVLIEQRKLPDELVLSVDAWGRDDVSVRIMFRVMASLGRSTGQATELRAGDETVFRYRPGGAGLVFVETGERVAPYDRDDS